MPLFKPKGSYSPEKIDITEYQQNGDNVDYFNGTYKSYGNDPLREGLVNSTSDHAYRVAEVKTDNMTLQVATYNMLNKAEKTETGFNNPFLIEEDEDEYETRKQVQILTLVDILTRKPAPDVVCLQEADWAFIYREITSDLNQKKITIQKSIQNILFTLGYQMIVTGGSGQQPLVTLFNTNSLKYNGAEFGMLPSQYRQPDGSSKTKNRAYGCVFTHIAQNKPIAICNAHLEYHEDYHKDKKLLKELNQKFPNMPVIVAGDFNHNLSKDMPYALTYENGASVVSAKKDRKNNNAYEMQDEKSVLTLEDHKTKKPAAYDAFYIVPAPGQTVTAQIVGGQEITLKGRVATFTDIPGPEPVKNITATPSVPTASVPAAGAMVVGGSAATASKEHAAKQARRILRNNIDALETFYEANEKNALALLPLVRKLQAATPKQKLMVDKENFVIVNQEMIDAATKLTKPDDFKTIIYSQINAYVTDKKLSMKAEGKTESRLLKGYQNMRDDPDAPDAKKFMQEMHGRAQVKKWTITDKLHDDLLKGLSGNERFVGFTQAAVGKHFIKDLVKIYENTDKPVFESNEDLIDKLNNADVQLVINGKSYYIRGKIKNDAVVFVKCEQKSDKASDGLSISESNVQSYMKTNNVESLAVDVMEKLGATLNKHPQYKEVIFKAPEKPKPPAPKPPPPK